MFGKKDKPIAVRKFSLAEFENLYKKINEYLESGDDAYPVNESVEISIYSNNNWYLYLINYFFITIILHKSLSLVFLKIDKLK